MAIEQKPLHFITREELSLWAKKNKQFLRLWQELQPHMEREGGVRGVRQWVFALGYIAGQRNAFASVEQMAARIVMFVEKVSDETVASIEKQEKHHFLG